MKGYYDITGDGGSDILAQVADHPEDRRNQERAGDRGADPGQSHEIVSECGRTARRHLLFQNELAHQVAATAAPFHRPVETDPALLANLLVPDLHEFGIVLGDGIRKVLVEESANFVAERLIFGREIEVHQIPLSAATRSQ